VKNSNTLTPSERSSPLFPSPENCHPLLSSSTILTSPPPPPSLPRDTCQTPNKHFLPSIVVSPPMSTTLIVLEPSWPIPPMATSSSTQSLPQIGTSQRPYYSTIRAHLRNKSPSGLSMPSSPIDSDAARSTHSDRINVSVLEGETTSYQPNPTVLVPDPSMYPPSSSSPPTQILSALYPGYDDDSTNEGYNEASVRSRTISARLGRALKKSSSSLWNCFARKSGRLSEISETKSEKKEVRYTTATPPLFPSRSFGSLGTMSGCWMSGEIETRMALAERERECNSEGGVQSGSAFRFRHTP